MADCSCAGPGGVRLGWVSPDESKTTSSKHEVKVSDKERE